jgi:hypothetical protein
MVFKALNLVLSIHSPKMEYFRPLFSKFYSGVEVQENPVQEPHQIEPQPQLPEVPMDIEAQVPVEPVVQLLVEPEAENVNEDDHFIVWVFIYLFILFILAKLLLIGELALII